MNPFRRKSKTINSVDINVTNIWILSTTVTGATRKKITRILDLNCAVNILIDKSTSLKEVDNIFLNGKLNWKLGHFKHIGTYTKNKGIIVIYDNNLVKVIQSGQLVCFLLKANNDWVNFSTMYAPPDNDNPQFMLNAK